MITRPIDLDAQNVIKIYEICLSDSVFRWSTEEATLKSQTGGLMACSWLVNSPLGYELSC